MTNGDIRLGYPTERGTCDVMYLLDDGGKNTPPLREVTQVPSLLSGYW